MMEVIPGTNIGYKELRKLMKKALSWYHHGIHASKDRSAALYTTTTSVRGAYVIEFLATVVVPLLQQVDKRWDLDILQSGSSMTHHNNEEWDFMLLMNDFTIEEDGRFSHRQLLTDDDMVTPGYACIKLDKGLDKEIIIKWKDCIIEHDGHTFLSSQKLVHYLKKSVLKIMPLLSQVFEFCDVAIEENGPAVTLNIHDFKSLFSEVKPLEKIEENMSIDLVLAVNCRGWPKGAKAFIDRNLESRIFPGKKTLQKWTESSLQENGLAFHVVGKRSDPSGDDVVKASLEWRISFSVVECKIPARCNDDLIKLRKKEKRYEDYAPLMRFIKVLKKAYLSNSEFLSSYHLKTIMWYTLERMSEEDWEAGLTISMITYFFENLEKSLVTKSCPHYFIPQINLFQEADHDVLKHFADVVSKIRKNPDKYFSVSEIAKFSEPRHKESFNDKKDYVTDVSRFEMKRIIKEKGLTNVANVLYPNM